MSHRVRTKILRWAGNLLIGIFSIMVLLPLYVLVINSFKTSAEANKMSIQFPTVWVFDNFAKVIEQGKLVSSFFNSLLYALVSVSIIVVVVSMAAFVIARRRKGVNNLMYYFIIAGIAIPLNNVSLMRVMQAMHLMNTRLGVILIYAAINIPLSLFLAYGFVGSIPKEIDEAAVLDGCGTGKLFLRVIAPLFTPIISTLFVLNFMSVWNDFTMPLYYLNNSSKWPMTLAVYNFFGAFENSWNLVSADIVLTLLPVLLVFLLGQKYIVGGISAGAVKG